MTLVDGFSYFFEEKHIEHEENDKEVHEVRQGNVPIEPNRRKNSKYLRHTKEFGWSEKTKRKINQEGRMREKFMERRQKMGPPKGREPMPNP
jgi:hypothetical protein